MSESSITFDGFRPLIGSIVLVGGIVLFYYCCYKLAVCRQGEKKSRKISVTSKIEYGGV
jgi:hypothetical protein